MSILNSSKVDVLRGWTPGGDAGIDQSLAPASGLTAVPGMVLALQTAGNLNLPVASANMQALYFVVEGNSTPEFDTSFVGKLLVLRGKLTVKTDQYVSTSMAPGRLVAVNGSGQFIDNGTTGTPGSNLTIGWVLENNTSVDGTVTLEIDL